MTDTPETTDILERLRPLPDRLAKEALDEIKRLRMELSIAEGQRNKLQGDVVELLTRNSRTT